MMLLCLKLTQGHAQNRGRQLKISDRVLLNHITRTVPVPGCWLIPPHGKDLQTIFVLGRVPPQSPLGPGFISAPCGPGAND